MATKVNIPTVGDVITGGVDAFDDLASTIANPPTDRPLQGALGAAGQKYCNFIGAIPGNASGLLGLGLPLQALLCKPYWDKNSYDAPVPDGGFTGGQCLVRYQVDGTFESFGSSTGATCGTTRTWRIANAAGPIGGIKVTVNPNEIRLQNNGGFTTSPFDVLTSASLIPAASCASAPNGSFRVKNMKITSVARLDGQPDVCGNPTPSLRPGPRVPPTPTFPPGEEPGVDPDGQPFFFVPPVPSPITGEPPIGVPEPSPGGDGGAGGGPTEPPVAGDEQSGTPGDEEFPPPEDGRRWVGCCIRLTSVPVGTGTVPGTSPETILTQVVGNVRLLFDSVSGDGYDTPVQIRSVGLCLWEPIKGISPKGVRVNLKPGFEYAYTPYSVKETE